MTTDITELALIAKIKSQLENFDTVVRKEGEAVALVEALEKSQQRISSQREYYEGVIADGGKRIAELDRKNCELDSLTQRWAVERAENADHIAELESRTVSVKLTDINEYLADVHDKTLSLAFRRLAEAVRAGDVEEVRAAGIKVEAE